MDSNNNGTYVKYITSTKFKTAPMRDPYKNVTSKTLTKSSANRSVQIQKKNRKGSPKSISLLRSKLKVEQERKKDLEKKLQTALLKSNRSLSSESKGTAQSNHKFSSRRMYRHPREMESDLLYAEDRFMEVQANADKLERVLKSVQLELSNKNEALRKSEEKVGTLVSMLQDLMSRLAQKELGRKYNVNDIYAQNDIWKEPLQMHFLHDDIIDDYIDEKLKNIQMSLDQANVDHTRGKNDDFISQLRANSSNTNNHVDTVINPLNVKVFWSQLVQCCNGKNIINYGELCVGIYKLCSEEIVRQKILKQTRSFIPDEANSDYMFGEEEFIAFLQQSTDPILKQYFNSEFHTM
jgi:chromosome segregation ATPase